MNKYWRSINKRFLSTFQSFQGVTLNVTGEILPFWALALMTGGLPPGQNLSQTPWTFSQLCLSLSLHLTRLLSGQVARITLLLIPPLSNFRPTKSFTLHLDFKCPAVPIMFRVQFNLSPPLQESWMKSSRPF